MRGKLGGIFADAVAVGPCLVGRITIDRPAEQTLYVLQPAQEDALLSARIGYVQPNRRMLFMI
jgi:hypothetical protein